MGGLSGLVVLAGVASLLTPSHCAASCSVTDGHPGNAGIPGRGGRPGAKGEKGEPGISSGPVDAGTLLRLKGEIGSRGKQGFMGPKGYRGEVGPAGRPGDPGPPGPDGRRLSSGQHSPQAHSAFSVMRTDPSYPAFGQVVTYQKTVVNIPGDFKAATGHFICSKPGVYYFTFHSVARVSVCLQIASTSLSTKLGFCDYNRNTDQILSGGVVLQLTAGQKVWLESFKDKQKDTEARDTNEKQIIFSGFLLFADSE